MKLLGEVHEVRIAKVEAKVLKSILSSNSERVSRKIVAVDIVIWLWWHTTSLA